MHTFTYIFLARRTCSYLQLFYTLHFHVVACLSRKASTVMMHIFQNAIRFRHQTIVNRWLSVRRDLAPLIKRIHPDMFAQESGQIQKTNLACLQTVNEMIDAIEVIQAICKNSVEENNSNSTTRMVEISSPLSKQYALSCYVYQTSLSSLHTVNNQQQQQQQQHQHSVKLSQVILQTPVELCDRQRLPITVIEHNIQRFMQQLGPLHTFAGIPNPFVNESQNGDRTIPTANTNTNQQRYSRNTTFLDDVSSEVFRKLQQHADVRAFEANIRHQNRLPTAEVFNTSSAQNRRSRMRDRKILWKRTAEEVDAFVANGGVLVSGELTVAEEFDAIKRLRHFLQDFGSDINFDRSSWKSVVIIINNHNSTGEKCVIQCIHENDKYVLLLPYAVLKKDKVSVLLEVIRTQLPMASSFCD